MTKRLSPERIAHQVELAKRNNDQRTLMLLGHIEAIEAELRDLGTLLRNENENYRRVNQELEEAKAEIARLNAAFESAVSAHNADYARLVEEHKQSLEEFAAYIMECEG